MSTDAFPLPVWSSGTLQNSIPANEGSLRLEMLLGRVNSATTTAQPGSPADGDIYIIPAGATGAQWATFTAGDLAVYYSGTWYAIDPDTAFKIARVVDTGALLAWNGSAWVNFETLLGAKGADIASAGTTDLSAATGWFVHVTGTTTITALGTAKAGTPRWVRFAGALTLTHNATSLILPTGANITTAANDVALFVSEGSGNWRCAYYQRADGTPLIAARVDIFTASGTWTKPTGATNVRVVMIAGGGGGGSGRKGAAGTVRSGGGGGSGGARSETSFRASDLPSTVAVTVGAGGTGGAAQSTNSTDGNAGADGGYSAFGAGPYFFAHSGGGGGGGGVAGAAPGAAGVGTTNAGALGGTASATGGVGGNSAGAFFGSGGGGAGGGITSGDSPSAGGSATGSNLANNAGTISGGAINTNGGNGGSYAEIFIGVGGAGGGGSIVGNGGNGGNGANYGAGGGGGGAALNGAGNSGAGGNGGPGVVLVYSW